MPHKSILRCTRSLQQCTRAIETYRAASLAGVATMHASPHRAVRDLYEPPTASQVVRRFVAFLEARMPRTN